jgi:hypothetical protein
MLKIWKLKPQALVKSLDLYCWQSSLKVSHHGEFYMKKRKIPTQKFSSSRLNYSFAIMRGKLFKLFFPLARLRLEGRYIFMTKFISFEWTYQRFLFLTCHRKKKSAENLHDLNFFSCEINCSLTFLPQLWFFMNTHRFISNSINCSKIFSLL